jgi:deoxyribonuclease-4
MCNALREAEKLGLDTVQVFTKNQQQWAAKPLTAQQIDNWHTEIKRLGWSGPAKGVSHASYLINLASPDDTLWKRSIDLMRDEIHRCEQLAIPYLVHHPGAYTTSTLADGIARIAAAYKILFTSTSGYRTISCLEGTAGGGSTIGGSFEHLRDLRAAIISSTGLPDRIGFCLDTCHLHAAGNDMSSRAAATATLDRFDSLCGITPLKCFHLNDSKGALGSKLDRHMHIGEGELSPVSLADSGFAAVVNHPHCANIPKILETPKDGDSNGTPWDTINLARLRSLLASSPIPPLVVTRPAAAISSKPPKPPTKSTVKPATKPAVKPAVKPAANKAPQKPKPPSKTATKPTSIKLAKRKPK